MCCTVYYSVHDMSIRSLRVLLGQLLPPVFSSRVNLESPWSPTTHKAYTRGSSIYWLTACAALKRKLDQHGTVLLLCILVHKWRDKIHIFFFFFNFGFSFSIWWQTTGISFLTFFFFLYFKYLMTFYPPKTSQSRHLPISLHPPPRFTSMDSWDATYGVKKLDKGTYNDDFHTFGLYWDEHELVRKGKKD